MGKIVCLGSVNVDITGYVERFPVPGETVSGKNIAFRIGGKGLNQMTAAARLGAKVEPICAVGDDSLSAIAVAHLEREGLDGIGVFKRSGCATGAAIIEIEEASAENRIAVFSGANATITSEDVLACGSLFDGALFLSQLETPDDALLTALKLAKEKGCFTLLNPAPAHELSDELLALVDLITPNETEAAALTGCDEPEAAAHALMERGVKNVLITLGSEGSVCYRDDGNVLRIAAQRVKAVDTVGAGDAYNGALAAALSDGAELSDAMALASHVAAIAVTRRGAAEAMPTIDEL